MKTKTYLADVIGNAGDKAQFDEHAKRIIADKGVLSWIIKYTVEELKDYSLEVTYDIRFYVLLPKGERIKLILNVEVQKDFYPGYDLVTRAVFYCTRMISAQLNTEFNDSNYDDIKKVYSIWICPNASRKETDTITEYHIEPRTLYGSSEIRHRYDLMSVVMVGLNAES